MKQYIITASCAAGLEELVAGEVGRAGGRDISRGKGVVSWRGSLESGYRCCLWSRYASRIFLQLFQCKVVDEESLYQQCLAGSWQDYFGEEACFAVNCTMSGNAPFSHNRYAALKVKDAIADSFRDRTGVRPSVRRDKPDFQVHLHLEKETATLALDMTGESLHRRGYRGGAGRAPLKENLAAAMVALGGWPREDKTVFLDPMCGTGTLLIEAVLISADIAPGLYRDYFGFWGWRGHDKQLWQELLKEAEARKAAGLEKIKYIFQGYDCDPVVVSSARQNVERAGLSDYIQIKQAELATLNPPGKSGLILSNLPYGERLSETALVAKLYTAYGRILKERFKGWRAGVFIANPELTDSFALPWQHKYKLFNGSIPCRLLTCSVPDIVDEKFWWKPTHLTSGSDDPFANRLRKNIKKSLKWAKREKINCFRIYDRDLPDYNLSIDLYDKWVHIHEYAPPQTIDPAVAEKRLRVAVKTAKDILGLRSDRVFIKKRARQKGKKQYEKKGSRQKMHIVREGLCYFLVNFRDYLDTGLFLDHRPLRRKIFMEAKGKRFLNLFGYTGTASVQAAMGGSSSTLTVDLSATYLHWTRMNMALNGLGEINNQVLQADCLQWLRECDNLYDLILLDPPTFSNTKKKGRIFDIQKDHITLINLSMSRLSSLGTLFFSTNYRQFKLDEELKKLYDFINISQQTIPFDFSRNKKIHMCWQVRKKKQQ